jgi:peptide deformylase
MVRKTFSEKLSQMTIPKVYPLIRLGLKHGQTLNNKTFEVESLSRKLLLHDIPSLQMTASSNGLAALSSPLIHQRNAVLVYNKTLIDDQWEGYKSSLSDYEVMINPKIKREATETDTKEEECSILPALYFTITRPLAVQVIYKDVNFIEKIKDFFGFTARVISHEIDHLKGFLPSNLKVCQGKCRHKYIFKCYDQVEKYYEDLTRDEMTKLENLYQIDEKFKKKVDSQNDKQEFFMRIILGDAKFSEYMTRKTEAFNLDIRGGKLPINTQDI